MNRDSISIRVDAAQAQNSSVLNYNYVLFLIDDVAVFFVLAGSDFLCVNELADHIKSVLRLIGWHHVASVVHPHESEVFEVFDGAACLVQSLRFPLAVILFQEFLLSVPDESICPSGSTVPVADIVLVTAINEHGQASVDQRSNVITPVLLEVEHQAQVR